MTGSAVQLVDVFCVHRTADGDAAALQGLTLEVATAGRVCVVGPSGAGKTTLLRVIAGLQMPSAGTVRVFGHDPGRVSARDRARLRHDWLGFLDQHADSALVPDLQLAQSVGLPLALRGIGRRQRRRRVAELLSAAGLADRARARPDELSGGERQRIAVCVALAHRPRLLLADEPTAELDPRSAATVVALIDELADAEGATVITVSHDPVLARDAPRAVQIEDGRVVEDRDDGPAALAVDRSGWLRLPDDLRRAAAIDGRAQARTVTGGVLISALDRPAGTGTGTGTGTGAGDGDGDGDGRGRSPVSPAAATVEPATVEFNRLGRRRGSRQILDGLTATLASGALTVVTGPSGTGKTTLLDLIAGLDRPDDGEVAIDGTPLSELDREGRARLRRERVGHLPQEPVPVGFLSAVENVALALQLRGVDRRQATDHAFEQLRRLGLGDRAQQRTERLSAGEAQRVALARAIACAHGLLIADEPTSRLDRRLAGVVTAALVDCAAQGQTVICATHDPILIAAADHELRSGRWSP